MAPQSGAADRDEIITPGNNEGLVEENLEPRHLSQWKPTRATKAIVFFQPGLGALTSHCTLQ